MIASNDNDVRLDIRYFPKSSCKTCYISKEDYSALFNSKIPPYNIYDLIVSSFFPVRTYNVRVLLIDLLLPGLEEIAKIRNSVLLLFTLLSYSIWIFVTLPIRLTTCIPRMVWNKNKRIPPLVEMLKQVKPENTQAEAANVTIFRNEQRENLTVPLYDLPYEPSNEIMF